MNQQLTLQRATKADVDTYVGLERSVASKTYSAITNPEEALHEVENNVCLFIKRGDTVVGSIDYQVKSDELIYLSGIVVLPEFQGQGIAREAFKMAFCSLNGVKRIDLVTHPHNRRAIALYLHLGFIIESWKDNCFGDGEPRIVMALIRDGQSG